MKSLDNLLKIVNSSKPMMFNYEKFYSGLLLGENTEFENYVSLILDRSRVEALEEIRQRTCRSIANGYTNPTIELLFNLISNPR